jgi:hypothetical protein
MEVGTKALAADKKEDAYNLFGKAFNLYTLFWGLNLQSINEEDVKKNIEKIDKKTLENIKNDGEKSDDNLCLIHPDKKDSSTFGKLKNFVSKAIDCCKE